MVSSSQGEFHEAFASRYLLVQMRAWERIVCAAAAILMVAPELSSTLIGIAMVTPVMVRQLAAHKRVHGPAPKPGAV